MAPGWVLLCPRRPGGFSCAARQCDRALGTSVSTRPWSVVSPLTIWFSFLTSSCRKSNWQELLSGGDTVPGQTSARTISKQSLLQKQQNKRSSQGRAQYHYLAPLQNCQEMIKNMVNVYKRCFRAGHRASPSASYSGVHTVYFWPQCGYLETDNKRLMQCKLKNRNWYTHQCLWDAGEVLRGKLGSEFPIIPFLLPNARQ